MRERATLVGRERKTQLPPLCPECGKPLLYIGEATFECLNVECRVIEVVRTWDGKIKVSKRSAV